jgi:hypothetical protein
LPALELGSASTALTMVTAKSINLSSSIWGVITRPIKNQKLSLSNHQSEGNGKFSQSPRLPIS